MKSTNKRDRISYYVGWGLAYGIFAGGMFSVLLAKHLLVVLCLGIAFGAAIGAIYGNLRLHPENFRRDA